MMRKVKQSSIKFFEGIDENDLLNSIKTLFKNGRESEEYIKGRMMKGIIVYKSKYGATKKYAQWLREETGF